VGKLMTLSNGKVIQRRWEMNIYGAFEEWYCEGKAELLGGKTFTVTLCPPQIQHGRAWQWTWSSAIADKQQTSWAMAGLIYTQNMLKVKVVLILPSVGREGIGEWRHDPIILNRGSRWKWLFSFTTRPLYPPASLTKGMGGSQSRWG